ncbi:MAG: pseudouridine-5'-phosphate glycosidase [Geodermatophilaceae bacterium]|nr:pseudouridine-5'-phosphate glycosidase [Geodermatophilaceae bacterium]
MAEALEQGRPVVALESTLLAHGLPRPGNFETGRDLEEVVRRHGAIPATIALLDGVAHIGLSGEELRRICDAPDLTKLSLRDLPIAAALGRSGATTVAGTAALASAAGISLFATGGLGGVHRGARDSFDESADLDVLARTRIVVVCAGVKSILDVPATLERLESLSVGVVGYQTSAFPGFYVTESGSMLDWRCETPEEIAQVFAAADGFSPGALVVANPLPLDRQMDPGLHDTVLSFAISAAVEAGMTGKDVTPYVLDRLHIASNGRTQEVNVDLVHRNAALAAEIAVAYTKLDD